MNKQAQEIIVCAWFSVKLKIFLVMLTNTFKKDRNKIDDIFDKI